ncbi:zinc-binding protein A33-like [Denticeps clupeoides]|uniref:Zinc-binding protein A33-like n=1 Tax=Denticeps clupeoides TaxID=299321 RepID=A0AAY4ASZ0_9TELE|nr:zinc-binding protein A33-like [Denticeps clupeoides]
MASKLAPDPHFFCPVCKDILRDPVLLTCTHNVCKVCLDPPGRDGSLRCPVCGQLCAKEDCPANRALKNLCESLLRGRSEEEEEGMAHCCAPHGEKLKLFCLEDEQPVCLVCRDSVLHENHKFSPVEEVARRLKKELKVKVTSLQEKLKMFSEAKLVCVQSAEHTKNQAQHTEMQIKAEFENLHQFLRDEEGARISALREENLQKSQMMEKKIKKMSREIASLSDKIQVLEEEMEAEDILFLQKYRDTVERAQCTLQNPERLSGALIHVEKHLGNLKFRVWEKMPEDIVQYFPVTLNPTTAHPQLTVSEDLTSVSLGEVQRLPDNPERFDEYDAVLGSEGFHSGTHCWDVEVGDNTGWVLGLMAESANPKGEVYSRGGIWCLVFSDEKYEARSTPQSVTVLGVEKILQKVRVQLDWDRGKVTFCDPVDNTPLCTLTHTFTKRVFPYFATICNRSPLRILPAKVSVTVN